MYRSLRWRGSLIRQERARLTAYTDSIDLHIAQTLRLHGVVTPEMLPGLNAAESIEALRRYEEIHSGAQRLHFDGTQLRSLAVTIVPVHDESEPPVFPRRWWAFGAVGLIAVIALAFAGFGRAGVSPSRAWPASPDGRVALYYFGTST